MSFDKISPTTSDKKGSLNMEANIISLNGFKIKGKYLPSTIYKFKLSFINENESEVYRKVRRDFSATPLSPPQNPHIEAASYKKPESIPFKEEKLTNLPEHKQEEMILMLFRWEYKIEKAISKLLPPPRKIEDGILIIPEVKKLTVKKINTNFYLFFDIGYKVRSLTNIYELIKTRKISYEELKGKTIIYDPFGRGKGKRSTATVKDIILNPDRKDLEYLKSYLANKEGYEIKEIPGDSPILILNFSNKKKDYHTLPSYCYLDIRKPKSLSAISNEKRKEILTKIALRLPYIENIPLIMSYRTISKPKYLVKTKNKNTRQIESLRKVLSYPAWFVPVQIKAQKNIPILLLIDKNLSTKETKNFVNTQTKKGYLKLNVQGNSFRFGPVYTEQVDFENFTFPDSLNSIISKDQKIYLALCILKSDLEEETYNRVKRILFSKNIISQLVVFKEWKKRSSLTSQILKFNIYSKLGIRLFSLAEKLPYDLIIGVDVGNDRFGKRTKAGCATVFLSNGTIETIIPLSIDSSGEKIDYLGEILELIVEKFNLKGKKILLIRDGNIYNAELKNIAQSPSLKLRNIEVDIVGIKKNHPFRILSDLGRKAVVLKKNEVLLLPHSTTGARPLLINQFFSIKNGEISTKDVTLTIVSVLYKLTKLNFSTPFREENFLRLPAPSHYSDKFVKALSRNWPVDRRLLEVGALYFI